MLGWVLCRRLPTGLVKLKIVETEAYHQADPASHSYAGLTKRTAPMFKAGGHIYVYFTYGMHHALNLVTGAKGVGEGVLIRAGEPVEGVEIMAKNRFGNNWPNKSAQQIASGPGKLAQALGIKDTSLSGKKLNKLSIWLEPPTGPAGEIITTTRIGVKKAPHQLWRFYLKDSPFVSKAVHK